MLPSHSQPSVDPGGGGFQVGAPGVLPESSENHLSDPAATQTGPGNRGQAWSQKRRGEGLPSRLRKLDFIGVAATRPGWTTHHTLPNNPRQPDPWRARSPGFSLCPTSAGPASGECLLAAWLGEGLLIHFRLGERFQIFPVFFFFLPGKWGGSERGRPPLPRLPPSVPVKLC